MTDGAAPAKATAPGELRSDAEQRLQQLRAELESGRAELERLDQRRAQLHEMLLRISGAVQVLEELLESGDAVVRHNGQ